MSVATLLRLDGRTAGRNEQPRLGTPGVLLAASSIHYPEGSCEP